MSSPAGTRDLPDTPPARLMPTAMHPWMDPLHHVRLWPHDNGEVYEAFNRIFDCRGHGWSNLQSLHVNLPFAGDEQFGRLHAAIRLILPILPALAASSPIVDGRATGILDNRLAAYRNNCARIPSMTGQVVPEPVFSIAQYRDQILQPIYRDLAPFDPDRILQHEWANARGAIARFDRNTIEIRVIDMQECPAADLAVVVAAVAVLKLLVAETWCDLASQQAFETEALVEVFDATVRDADKAVIANQDYLRCLGWSGRVPCTAGELCRQLIKSAHSRQPADLAFCQPQIETILQHGPLARRILQTTGPNPSPQQLASTYRQLCDCLAAGRMYSP